MFSDIYAHEGPGAELPSIFLAGPSPREESHPNWRPEALGILRDLDFNGLVFIPLPRDGKWLDDYDAQVLWERTYLKGSTVIAFWIPRDLETLPGFTTNVEYGMFLESGKIVLGYPQGAPKMRYLHTVAEMEGVPIFHTLTETLAWAVRFTRL